MAPVDRELSDVLRREEVARPAGVSTDHCGRLGQRRPVRPMPGVLDAVAVAPALGGAGRTRPGAAVATGHGVVADEGSS